MHPCIPLLGSKKRWSQLSLGLWAILLHAAWIAHPVEAYGAASAAGHVVTQDRAFVDSWGRIHFGGRVYAKNREVLELCSSGADQAQCCLQGLNVSATYAGITREIVLPRSVPESDFAAIPCAAAFGSSHSRSSLSGHVLLHCMAVDRVEVEVNCGCVPGKLRVHLPHDPRTKRTCKCGRSSTQTVQVRVKESLRDGEAVTRPCSDLFPGSVDSYDIICSDGSLEALWDSCVPTDTPAGLHKRRLTTEATVEQLLDLLEDRPCDNPPQDQWWPSICGSLGGNVYSTVAGGSLPGSSDNQLNAPHGIYVSPGEGDVYIADWHNHRIQRWTAAAFALGGGVTLMAGRTGERGETSDVDLLWFPTDIVVAGRSGECGDLFIADGSNNRVLRWPQGSLEGQVIAGKRGGIGDDQLDSPQGLFVTDDLSLYIADMRNHRIVVWVKEPDVLLWKFDRIAAGRTATSGSSLERLNRPFDVALDSEGNLYIADHGNNRVLRWEPGATAGVKIGSCTGAYSVFVDIDDAIYAACSSLHCIKRWESYDENTWIESNVAGDCGLLSAAPGRDDPLYELSTSRFFSPQGVFVSADGDIYVADTTNARVIKRTRDPLTMWVVSNSVQRFSDLSYSSLAFYTDVACSMEAEVRGNITADGVLREPWTPRCVQEGYCEANEAWIGRFFWGPKAVRCVRLIANFTNGFGDTADGGLSVAVQYWTGQSFKTLYNFGGLTSGEEVLLRPPRFNSFFSVCAMGQRFCVLSGVIGDWQADGDRIQVKAGNCESGSIVNGLPNEGMSDPSTDGGTTFQFGDESTTILADASEGADYFLCWCDNRQKLCRSTDDFDLHIGNLSIHGPNQGQSKVSTLGTALRIEGVSGVELKEGDMMTVVSGQCGAGASQVFGMPEAFSQPSADGSDYYWGPDLVRSIPGIYTLCWCRPANSTFTGATCNQLVDYGANAGSLLVAGPFPGQNFFCIKGDVCILTLRGVEFAINDNLMILERCGQGDQPLGGFPNDYALGLTTGGSSDYSWGNQGIDPAVGLYYVCWCSRAAFCTKPQNFLTEVGVLTVLGPSVTDGLECYMGRDCVVANITGTSLETTSSRLLVTNRTCGELPDNATHLFPGDPSMNLVATSFPATADGTSFRFGYISARIAEGDLSPVKPAIYTLCWCHAGLACNSSTDFRVKLGTLSVNGPVPAQREICGTGADCEYSFEGVGLSLSDSLVIKLRNCSGTLPVQENPALDYPSTPQTTNGVQAQHAWKGDQMPLEGGRYVVCWCGVDCVGTDSFAGHNVLVGTIDIPTPREDNSGRCFSGRNCTVLLTGFGLSINDQLAVMEDNGDCGSASFLPGVPNEGVSLPTLGPNFTEWNDIPWELAYYRFGGPMTAVGGDYPLCWCAVGCTSALSFNLKVGQIEIMAPSGGAQAICFQGLPCTLTSLAGTAASVQDGDRIRISTQCNPPAEEPVGGIPLEGISLDATDGGRTFSWGNERVTGAAIVGTYRMCWCSAGVDCSGISNYLTEIGTMLIAGPDTGASQACDRGYPCELASIRGQNLLINDAIIISVSCQAETALAGTPKAGYIARQGCNGLVTDDPLTCANFEAQGVETINDAEPGMYRMCWCSAEGSCNPDVAEDFHTDVGLFVSRGPSPGQVFACVPGFKCSLPVVNGIGLNPGDRYFASNGECGDEEPAVGMPNNGITEPAVSQGTSGSAAWDGDITVLAVPQAYDLCWCPGTQGSGSCTSGTDFNAGVGTLQIVGPSPDQYRECSVGSACILSDIEGFGLQNSDRALVIEGDNCGDNVVIPAGFPGNGLSDDAENAGRNYPFGILSGVITRNYTMCWCANSRVTTLEGFRCTDGDSPVTGDFIINFGKVFVPEAPAVNLRRTCISGQHCELDNLVGAVGNPLRDDATVLIAGNDEGLCPDTVELASQMAALGWPNTAISNGATQVGTFYSWGLRECPADVPVADCDKDNIPERITAQGGNYSMCWKPADSQVYAYYFGVMTVVGPAGGASAVCTKRAACVLTDIRGEQLAAGDFLLVMDRCAGNSLFGVEATRMTNSTYAEWTPDDFQGTPGSNYKLCWCSGQNGNDCSLAAQYATEVGEMTIQGPTPGQNKACDRGKVCTINRISGIALQALDKTQILVECGTGPIVSGVQPAVATAYETEIDEEGEFTYTWSSVTSRPGIYRMCWCAHLDELADPLACSKLEGFDVEVGIITIQGPEDIADEFVPYDQDWELQLTGVNLQNSPGSRLRILKECGDSNGGVGQPAVEGVELTLQPVGFPNEDGDRFTFNVSAIQVLVTSDKDLNSISYRLCWCRGPTDADPGPDCGGDDGNYSDFNLDLGGLVQVECAEGSRPLTDGPNIGTCVPCDIGWYKEVQGNLLCVECKDSDQTTTSVGSISQDNCFCKPGFYWARGTNCEVCPPGDYCPGIEGEDTNFPCPANSATWTDCTDCVVSSTGNSKVTDCQCLAGFQPTPNGPCEPCPLDTSKAKAGNQSCQVCSSPVGSSTLTTGSVECVCIEGLYLIQGSGTQGDLCADCPRGYYCPGAGSGQAVNISCNNHETTLELRSVNQSQCKCSPGFFRFNGDCISCPASRFYKPETGDGFELCTGGQCPDNSAVPAGTNGPRDEANCQCDPGYEDVTDLETGRLTCEERDDSEDEIPNPVAQVPSLEGGIVLYNVPASLATDPYLLRVILAMLGLSSSEADRLSITSTDFTETTNEVNITVQVGTDERRLDDQTSNGLAIPRNVSIKQEPLNEPEQSNRSSQDTRQYTEENAPQLADNIPTMSELESGEEALMKEAELQILVNDILENDGSLTMDDLILEDFMQRVLAENDTGVNDTNLTGNGTKDDPDDGGGVTTVVTTSTTTQILGTLNITIQLWQSTRSQAITLQDAFRSINTNAFRDSVAQANPAYSQISAAAIENKGIVYQGIDCRTSHPNTFVQPGTLFVSPDVSCVCGKGYEKSGSPAWNLVVAIGLRPEPAAAKCWECPPGLGGETGEEYKELLGAGFIGTGYYKDSLGDHYCSACQARYPVTDPATRATSQLQCACPNGHYRDAKPNRSQDTCEKCPPGSYCTGNTRIESCPEHEWTVSTDPQTGLEKTYSEVGDCLCSKGYFREVTEGNASGLCKPCSTGYYKETISDGIGRCTLRCSRTYGPLSTSYQASQSENDCFCSSGSYLPLDGSETNCKRCPSEGVRCTGEFDANGTHAQPVGLPGFFMISASLVKECQTDQGLVCLGGPFGDPQCAPGHFGVICGVCSAGHTRDRFPERCTSCNQMSGTAGMVMEILAYFTVQALFYEFLAFASLAKTETQKHVLVVLLRMFQHWSAQATIILQFNLDKIKPMISEDNTAADTSSNVNGTDENLFPWPKWQQTAYERILILQNVFEGTTSLQAIMECLVDRGHVPNGVEQSWEDEGHTLLKLVIPAVFWICYPLLLSFWVFVLAFIQGKMLLPFGRFLITCYDDGLIQTLKAQWKSIVQFFSKDKRKGVRRRYASSMASLEDLASALGSRRSSYGSAQSKVSSAKPSRASPIGSDVSRPSVFKAKKDVGGGGSQKSFKFNKQASSSLSSLDLEEGEPPEEDFQVIGEEEDSDFDSEFSTEKENQPNKKKRVASAVYTPQMLRLADDLNSDVMHPKRFSFGYILKDHEEMQQRSGRERVRKVDYSQCVLRLFRKRPNIRQLLTDITPWIVIAMNDSWGQVTNRMLQLLYCEAIPQEDGTFVSRLASHTNTMCWEMDGVHLYLVIIALIGLFVWSFGIVAGMYLIITSHDLQSSYVQRNFGYLIEGYEPQCWGWELTVKKVDLLVTALITYTSLAGDVRAKLLLYSMQSFIAFAVQLSAGPYDDRQLRLLDRMENTGLIARNILFTGIAIALLFDLSDNLVLAIATILMVAVIVFMLRLLFHSIDDFVGSKVVMVHEQKSRLAHDMEEKRRVRMLDGVHPDDIRDDRADVLRMRYLGYQEKVVKWLFYSIFYGEWRRHQLLHLEWTGPGSDAQVYMPKLYDGFPPQLKRKVPRTISLKVMQFIFNLNQDFQLEVLKNLLEDFVNLLIQLAKFRQLPAQLTDMIFFLARAVKLMKKSMMEHPNTKRVVNHVPRDPNTGEVLVGAGAPGAPAAAAEQEDHHRRHRHTENLSHLDRLKTAMLEEMFERLLAETRRKAELIETMRSKFNGVEVIQNEKNFPMQAAWDIMDKLTTDQLRLAASCPVHLYKRVKFNLAMSRCGVDLRDAMSLVKDEMKKVKERRKEIYTYIAFALRKRLEAIPDVDWAAVRQVLDMLPVEELERLGKEPELCIEQVLESRAQQKTMSEFRGDSQFFLTVEDINSMLMYIQKLPYNELHILIEYTQLLLDYLTLPTNAEWRSQVALRGERERAAPDFYHHILRLKRQLREDGIQDDEVKDEDEDAQPQPDASIGLPALAALKPSSAAAIAAGGLGERKTGGHNLILTLPEDGAAQNERQTEHGRQGRSTRADPALPVLVNENDAEDDDTESIDSMDSLVANMIDLDEEEEEEDESEDESVVGEIEAEDEEEEEDDDDDEEYDTADEEAEDDEIIRGRSGISAGSRALADRITSRGAGISDKESSRSMPLRPSSGPEPRVSSRGMVSERVISRERSGDSLSPEVARLEALRRRAGAGAFDDWEDDPATTPPPLGSDPASSSGHITSASGEASVRTMSSNRWRTPNPTDRPVEPELGTATATATVTASRLGLSRARTALMSGTSGKELK